MKRMHVGLSLSVCLLTGALATAQTPSATTAPVPANYTYSDNSGGGDGIVGGFGLLFLPPHWQTHGTRPFTINGTAADFNTDWQVQPRLWFGMADEVGNGWRMNLAHLDYRQQLFGFGAGLATPGVGTVGLKFVNGTVTDNDNGAVITPGKDQFQVENKFQLDTVDLEVTCGLGDSRYVTIVSAGLRYALLRQSYAAIANNPSLVRIINEGEGAVDTDAFAAPTQGVFMSKHDFSGIGPTVALECHHPLSDSGLTLFGSVRGAALFGTNRVKAAQTLNVGAGTFTGADEAAPATGITTASDTLQQNQFQPVIELAAGVEYAMPIMGEMVYWQVALMDQEWLRAGNATSRHEELRMFGILASASVRF